MSADTTTALLGRLSAGVDLSRAEMAAAMDEIMQGHWSDAELAMFLTALRHKGETAAEIAGAAETLRRHMTPIRTRHTTFIDTCGTGGDGSGTFNISTAAAIVTAAAGVPVAKHGNRRATSKSGSADVLAELGVNVEASLSCVEACLDELGLCFCFAPLWHGAMKHVGQVRRSLGVPTIFNLLGPLVNPASAPHQLLGVGRPALRPLLAQVLAELGTVRSAVVCGEDGLDEVTLAAATHGTLATGNATSDFEWTPEEFGITRASLETLVIDGPAASAAMIRTVLAGEPGPARDIVILNAAAALWTVEKVKSPADGAALAAQAIDSGAARELLAKLVDKTTREA